MGERKFCLTSDDNRRAAYSVTCSNCETIGMINGSGAHLPQVIVQKKFSQLGWSIGRNATRDLCPECGGRSPKLSIVPSEEDMKTNIAAVSTEPMKLTRDTRRLILSKLEEVYLDERRGYSDDWSDERVAVDMGVPRVWVTTLRDENFGPAHNEKAKQEVVKELREIELRVTQDLDRIRGLIKEFVS